MCKFCDQVQSTNETLDKHTLSVHGVFNTQNEVVPSRSLITNQKKDLVCELCEEQLLTQESLEHHSLNVHGVLSQQDHYTPISNDPRSTEFPMSDLSDLQYMELNSFLVFPTFKVETWPTNQRGSPYYLAWKNPSSGTLKKADIKDGSIVMMSCGLMPQPQVAEGNITVKNNTVVLSIRNSYGVNMTLYPHIPVPGITAHLLPYIREEVTKVNPAMPTPLITNLPKWHLHMKKLKLEQWSVKKAKGMTTRNSLVRQGDPSNLTMDLETDFRAPIVLSHPNVNVTKRYTQFGPYLTQDNPRAVRVTPNTRCTKVLCRRCTDPIYCHCDCVPPRK